MTLEAAAQIGEAVGGIAVVASLAYLVVQIRQNTRSVRAATVQSIVSTAAACNQTLSQNPALARILRVGSAQPSALDPDERIQFEFLCLQFFDIFENLYLQYRNGGLDESYWAPRRRSFLTLFDCAGFRERWTHVRENYSTGFREMVESGLASLRAEPAP